MAAKKRNSASEEEIEFESEAGTSNDFVKPLKKKKKKAKRDGREESLEGSSMPSSTPSSDKPMERRKKRKALDKERRCSAIETEGSKPVQIKSELKTDAEMDGSSASTSGVLPEFHIGVFKDLASADGPVREAAAETLVRELQEVQSAYDRLARKELVEGSFKLEAEKDDGLDNCAPSLRYAIRRLIRGVSSSRECARQGFALGLTVLVGRIPQIRVESILKLAVDLLEVSSSMKGQEIRDCLLGRLFAYGALAQSRRLTGEWNLDKNTPYIREFVNLLVSLADKKRYLQEPTVSIILDLVEKLPVEALINHVLETPKLHEWFKAATEVGNPDALLLALKIREKISIDSFVFGKLLPNPFSSSKLFSDEHLQSLCNCLKESTFCQPRVHSVWPALINILLPNTILQVEDAASASNSLKKHKKGRKSSSSEEEIASNLKHFCEVIIEGELLFSSHDRKNLAFNVLFLLLQMLSASYVPIVLSNKVVQGVIDILSTKSSWLYKVAQHFLKQLSDWIGDDDVRRVAVIVALQKHSNGKFDRISQTRFVKDLMAQFKTESGCMLFIQNLMNMFIDEGNAAEEPSDQSQTTDENSEIGSIEDKDSPGAIGNSDHLKSWVIESLPSILKYLKLDQEKFRVQKEIMKFLAVQGLFTASLGTEVTSFELQEKFRWPKAPTSNALCKICIEQLQSLLASAQKGESSRPIAHSIEPNDLGSYFMRFFGTLRNIPSVSLFRSLDGEDEKAAQNLQVMEARLFREEKSHGPSADANRLRGLRYLLIQLLLQVLLRPGEYSEAASELIICCKKAFSVVDLPELSGANDAEDDAAPELMDVLVDTLLSLLPQSSVHMRLAIEQVFKYFCEDITDEGLQQMLRVIKKNLRPARHPDEEGKDEDDDDDNDDDDLIDIEDEEIDQAETGDSDEQTDDSEAVVEVEETGNEHPEASDDSDSGMDDDAMFQMDTYLAQIFKEKKNQTGSETAHSQLLQFKFRILSLLEIYLNENPGKSLVLKVYRNLAQAFVNPHTAEVSEQLSQRIWGIILKKILKAKDHPRGDSLQISTLEALLKRSLKLASKSFKKNKSASNQSKQSASVNRHKMIVYLGQNSTFWILKIIDSSNFPESELQKFIQIFKDILEEYFENSKKCQLKSEFLKKLFRNRPWIEHNMFGFLLEKCKSAKSDFRQVEALELVKGTFKSLKDDQNAFKKILKNNLANLSHLVEKLVTNMPNKQSRRAEARKFCVQAFQILSTHNLNKSFLKTLTPEADAALEKQLGEQFINFKKLER